MRTLAAISSSPPLPAAGCRAAQGGGTRRPADDRRRRSQGGPPGGPCRRRSRRRRAAHGGGPQTGATWGRRPNSAHCPRAERATCFDSAISRAARQMIRAGQVGRRDQRLYHAPGFRPIDQAGRCRAAYLQQHPNFGASSTRPEPCRSLALRAAEPLRQLQVWRCGRRTSTTSTGNHLDNIANMAGGDGKLVNLGLETAREDHPYASDGGRRRGRREPLRCRSRGRWKVAGKLAGTQPGRSPPSFPAG
jgi:hypothetical protein